MTSSIKLTDAEIVLRPFHFEDSTQLYQAVRESLGELSPWMSWATEAYTVTTAREYIPSTHARWEERTLFAFAITRGEEILGACTLSSIHAVYRYCNLGYWVRTSRHGQGIAGRAAKLAARFAFEKVGLIRTEIVIAVGNRASIRVAEKVGAHYEGVLLNRMIVGKSVYDAHMYSLIPSDFGVEARL